MIVLEVLRKGTQWYVTMCNVRVLTHHNKSENVTVRGGLSSFAKGLLHKKHVKKYKVIVEEQSRVSRLLEDMRK
jgi:hypothetical protein